MSTIEQTTTTELKIQAASLDTKLGKRDEHLLIVRGRLVRR